MWAIVPVKHLSQAKQRLSGLLTAQQRGALGLAMLADLLTAATRANGLAGVMLVSPDTDAQAMGRDFGARILDVDDGLNDAVARAAHLLAGEGVANILVLHADLPLATPADIERLITAHSGSRAVTIAPDSEERGTNVMACSPPEIIPFLYGRDSFGAHLAAARAEGVEPTIVRRAGLAFDIDTSTDIFELAAGRDETRAQRYLHTLRLDDSSDRQTRHSVSAS